MSTFRLASVGSISTQVTPRKQPQGGAPWPSSLSPNINICKVLWRTNRCQTKQMNQFSAVATDTKSWKVYSGTTQALQSVKRQTRSQCANACVLLCHSLCFLSLSSPKTMTPSCIAGSLLPLILNNAHHVKTRVYLFEQSAINTGAIAASQSQCHYWHHGTAST